MAESSSLTFLDLVKNSINATGAHALAEALGQNSSLKALHLGMNNIGDEGLTHLAGALTTNQSLLTLDVCLAQALVSIVRLCALLSSRSIQLDRKESKSWLGPSVR